MTPEVLLQFAPWIVALLILIGGALLIRSKANAGWGPYNLQALGLVLFIPMVFLLAVGKVLSNEVVATLLGSIIGYVFGRGSGAKASQPKADRQAQP